MAGCRQATSHYLSQCWPRFLSPYGVIRPQWVKPVLYHNKFSQKCHLSMCIFIIHILYARMCTWCARDVRWWNQRYYWFGQVSLILTMSRYLAIECCQTITGTSNDRHDFSNHRKIPLFVQTFAQETLKLHITGPLWGEATGHRWIPLTKVLMLLFNLKYILGIFFNG